MANLPPNHVADLPEDNPEEQPELAPEPDHLNMFAPHQIPQPDGNMNGWILEDDEEEEEEEEDPEMEEEIEEENNDDDDAEVINPYEEADPLNLPPPDSDTESEDTAVAPTPDDHEQEDDAATVGTITRVPYSVRPFSGTVYVGTGPSRRVFAPGPTARDVNTLHRQSIVGTLLHVPGKTKDGLNARLDLAELGVKPELFAMQDKDKTTLPPVGYTLTNAEKDIFCETLHNIKVERELAIDKESVSETLSGVSVEEIDLHISKELATTRQTYYYGVLQEIWVLDYHFRQINHKSGGVKRDKLGYILVDLNNLGHKTPPKNYKDTYDEVDEEFSTVVHHRNDNVLPLVDRRDLANESRDDYYRKDCGENIVVNLDSSSDNNNSDSYSTSQISTSEEIDYDSPEPPKSLLKWYHYLSDEYKDNGRFWGSKSGCNESDVKPSWKDIKKAKACMLAKAQASEASSKAKVEARGQDLWSEDTMTFAEEKIGKRKLRKIIDISLDSSDDKRWATKKASAPVFYGPSTQGLLDSYGYNIIKEYLSWNYFPSTDNESTDKRNTDKDCIVDSNSTMSKGKYVPVCKKNKPNMFSHVQVTRYVLGLPNVTTWDEIKKKMGARKSKTSADKA
ncbi:hypothetical protein Tco_1315812 [Tanacetum coccineum]